MEIRQEPQLLQLAELFDRLPDVRAWVKDREGRFCWLNRTYRLLYSPGDPDNPGVMGKTVHDVFPAYLADQFQMDDDYVLAGNRLIDRVELSHLPDQTTAWHVTNKIPLFGGDGKIFGTAGITRPLDMPEAVGLPATAFGPVLAYMRDNHNSPITNDDLARLAHMSRRSFERKFLACFHVTPQAYIRKMRMRMASHTLVYTNRPLSVVAANCGFADQSHFSREFRRYFGRSPREYREHYSKEPGGKQA